MIKNQNIYIKFEAIFYYIINRDDFNDDKQSETESVIETDESTFTFVEESKESEQSEEAEKE
ncbi:MAG: hypothetical protein IIX47_08110, partial [Spirochaetaceae bacterium]|nr:hypothetical protein [Spirochaetaceae bacterium]